MVPPFRPQQPQQRRPLPPGHPGLREQGPGPQREQQPPQQGQPQSQHQPNDLHRQQPSEELEPNQGNQPPHLRKPKPQRMSTFKLLKRLLQGERRQDFGENQPRPGQKAGPNGGPDQTGQASQIPAASQNLNGVANQRRPPAKADKNLKMSRPRPGQPQPTMTFQGPLPPIIVNRNGQKKPNRKSGRPGPTRSGNVLDPISAQIIGGKPIQGVHQAATGDASLKAEDRMYVESFLFGPGESPRSLGAGSADLFG